MFNINGTLRFSDDEAYKNFLAAMEIAYAEGRVVQVDGVTSVATTVGHLGAKFPLELLKTDRHPSHRQLISKCTCEGYSRM